VDTRSQTVVLAQTLNRTREADKAPDDLASVPARGVAPSFDSLEATQRLAVLTGAATAPGALLNTRETATQAIRSLPRAAAAGWRRRDWLLVGAATLGGLVLARAIVKRDGPEER
jgi:hypothetical protein